MGRTRESANLVSDKNIFVDIANDLVGIGTTAPTATLEVSGTLAVSGISTFQNNVDLGDDDKLRLGTGNDIQIWHSGTYSNIKNDTGQLRIRSDDLRLQNNAANENYLTGAANGAVTVYYDNSAKLATKSDGVDITGELQCDTLDVDGAADITGTATLHGNLDLQDSDQILLGTSDDLQIYHDGSNSYISEGGTGVLKVSSNRTEILSGSGEICAHFQGDGPVDLYHDNSRKLETTGGGINVTGVATATSFSGDGSNLTNVPTGFSPINFVLS